MAEVTRQLEPTHSLLQQLHEWQLAFWSNGSGRVPGFFQTRMREDDRWRAQATEKLDELGEHKQSVDRFIVELRQAREFREKREAEAKARKKFWLGILWKVGGPMATGLIGLLSWGVAKATPIVRILIDDYLRSHPHVSSELEKRTSATAEPVVSYEREGEQSAHIPVLR